MFANVMLNFYLLYVILRSIKYIELFKDDFLFCIDLVICLMLRLGFEEYCFILFILLF